MATLHALLAQVAGHGQVVGVVGEPGLGKSRLVYEFRRSLGRRRLTYRAGRCFSYGSTTPYLPVLDLLHHCGIADTDGPEDITAKIHRSLQEVDMAPEEWAPVLLHLLGLEEGTNPPAALSPEARKARILTAVTQMCLHGSRHDPSFSNRRPALDRSLLRRVPGGAGGAYGRGAAPGAGDLPPWVSAGLD